MESKIVYDKENNLWWKDGKLIASIKEDDAEVPFLIQLTSKDNTGWFIRRKNQKRAFRTVHLYIVLNFGGYIND